jgi:transposase
MPKIGIMSFIRYKRFGNKEYAYEVTAYWDPQKKKSRQKSKYLGIVVDKEKGIFKKKEVKIDVEKLILDFGDVYILHEFMKNIKLRGVLHEVFSDRAEYLSVLICYRLCHPSAMKYARLWYQGNIARLIFRDIDLSSQRISDFLEAIGDESLQRKFFKNYISSFIKSKEGVIIDTTALPNQIHFPFSTWGYSDGEIEKQIKFLFVVDKNSSLPLYFRYLPGNIVDVSSLNTTVEELKMFGIKSSFVLIDAGFFSEDNIKELYTEEIDFLTRLPSSRKLYKNLIRQEVPNIETLKNAVRYGKRGLFIKQKKIELFGKEAYAHIILDPERKGRETRKLLINAMEEEEINDEHIEFKLMKCGIMILVSSFEIEKKDVVPFYYMRQMVERLFGFSKDDLELIPLRVHKEETLRGYLMLMFMTLIVFVMLRKAIGGEYTVEEVLLTMRNLKCKVYENEILIHELSKQQKGIVEKLNIIVPKKMGV